MAENPSDIVIVESRIEPPELARLVLLHFEDMVKYVVDIERRLAAVGGELHADADVRASVREITLSLIGEGETLP